MTEDESLKKAWREALGVLGGMVGALVFAQMVVGVVRKRIQSSQKPGES